MGSISLIFCSYKGNCDLFFAFWNESEKNIAVTNGKALSHIVNKICLRAELFNGQLENERGEEVSRKVNKKNVVLLFSNTAEKAHLCSSSLLIWVLNNKHIKRCAVQCFEAPL